MMASRRASQAPRPRKLAKRKGGMLQYAIIGAVALVVLIVAVVAASGASRQSSKPKSTAAAVDSGVPRRGSRSRQSRTSTSRLAGRRGSREEKREERRREREEVASARVQSRRTRRTEQGSYSRVATGRNAPSQNELTAIITDATGSRLAIVGTRRVKAGDDLEGRKIVEVGSDGVKVEYRQNVYQVRIGQPVY